MCQLWHMGRSVPPSFLNGAKAISASATVAPGSAYTYEGKQPQQYARALEISEIPRLLDDYRAAAASALKAGFDGVEAARGKRISAGSIPARQLKPAYGCLWWKYRESHSFDKRSNRRSYRSCGCGSDRRFDFHPTVRSSASTTAIPMRCFLRRRKPFQNSASPFSKFASLRRPKCSQTPGPGRCGPALKCRR